MGQRFVFKKFVHECGYPDRVKDKGSKRKRESLLRETL
jgi:hypothetical protein